MTDESDTGAESALRRADGDRVVASRTLPIPPSDLARSLVMLERPAAVTGNDTARITQIAAYAAPSAPGDPFLVERGWTSVRIDPDAVAGAQLLGAETAGAIESGHGDMLPALQWSTADDRPVHRCHALHDADRLVIDGLARAGSVVGEAAGGWSHPVPARDDDEEPDQRERLDELLTRSTAERPAPRHGHVDPGVLFALMEHVCSVSLPLGIAVLSAAALHTVQDVVHAVTWSSGLAVVSTHDAVVEIALSLVRHCVLVRLHGAHGPTSMIELYDSERRCVLVLSQFGMVGEETHSAWEHLVDSLPAAH